MPFEDLANSRPIDSSITLQKSSVALSAEQLNINPSTLAQFTTVRCWQELLTTQSKEERQLLHTYCQTMGYITDHARTLPANLLRNREHVIAASEKLIHGLVSGTVEVEALLKASTAELKAEYPGVSRGQLQLLRNMLQQRVNLDRLDIESVTKQNPFPVTDVNFFGRFLASGCDTPQQAARHLQLSNPFLIRMLSLIEGLGNVQKNFLTLDIFSAAEREADRDEVEYPSNKRMDQEQKNRAINILHATINHSSDFFGTSKEERRPLNCITMPRLPNINASHIDSKRQPELAVALYNWLFFGERTHELLTSRSLTPAKELLAQRYTSQLETYQKELKALYLLKPARGSAATAIHSWRSKESALQNRIIRTETNLEDLNRERAQITPIIKQLERNAGLLSDIRSFRSQIKAAADRGAKIVFSFFGKRSGDGSSNIIEFLDDAMTNRKESNNPAVKLLKESSFLLTPEATRRIRMGQYGSVTSVDADHIRDFEINVDEINTSAQYLVAGILPQRYDPKLHTLLQTIVKDLPPPGVRTTNELTYLVREATGKTAPNVADYIDYTFEHLPAMSQAQLLMLVKALHELDISSIPPRALELSLERFRHPANTLESFSTYARNYHPSKLGEAPEIFTDLASFEAYLGSGLGAFGMSHEVAQIEKHLKERGIVAVVDGTNYHPELDTVVGATGDKLDKSATEKTTEVWGEYVRPYERVVRALSLRLMEGDVDPSLKDSSLMGIVQPDKVAQVYKSLIRKIYGIDIDITPDLSTINQLLADLKLHDDKVILVIDARAINDLEEYRKFIGLFEKYDIKIILRTREPFPGIPQVNIQPFLDDSIADRIMAESERLTGYLDLKSAPERRTVEFAANQVARCRVPQSDPLNLTLQVLQGAASHARLYPDRILTEQDVVAALPPIFHLPDGQQMRLRLAAVESFLKRAPIQVLGQDKPIEIIGSRIKNHILGLRDATRPLTLLLPGPTGVGKTELMMYLARICDIPFFQIEGAEFSEEHTVSRLVGSPTGYVGPDEGVLYRFLKENNVGLIFIDEIEKMHPSVYQALMNFFDKATLTAGNGETVSRPGMIIVGASNAGAGKLTRDMSQREVKEVLADSFLDRFGNPRPELVRRFEPIVMHAIEESAFKRMLNSSLNAIGDRPGFINANLRLTGFDDAALELLYNSSREVCEYHEKSLKFGFGVVAPQASSDLFFDMRHVSRALDDLAGDSLQQIAVEQYLSGRNTLRGQSSPIRLVGNRDTGKIEVEVVAV